MATQFYCMEAPSTRIPCQFCGPEGEWTLDMPGLLNEHGRCDDYCDGTQEEPSDPRVEVGNAYRLSFLNLVGLPCEEWGEITPEQVPAILRQIMGVLNREGSTDHMVEAPSDGRAHESHKVDSETGLPTISSGPRVISMGLTDDRIRARVESLRTLLIWAKDRGLTVTWS